VVTCDLGLTRDRAAAAVLHRHRGKLVLDDLRVWEGSRERPVRIAEVGATLEDWFRRFRPRACVLDPWEMRAFIQDHPHWPITEFRFSGRPMHEMAQALYRAIADGRLELYPEAGKFRGRDGQAHDLQEELVGLVLIDGPSGYRFDHAAGRHNDMSIAVGMGVWHLVERREEEPPWRRMLHAELAIAGAAALAPDAQWARYARAAGLEHVDVAGMRIHLARGRARRGTLGRE
jgi:hypothetical protein